VTFTVKAEGHFLNMQKFLSLSVTWKTHLHIWKLFQPYSKLFSVTRSASKLNICSLCACDESFYDKVWTLLRINKQFAKLQW